MLRGNNLKIEYSELLFEDLTFSLGNKEKVGLVGLNGCGKTTLMKMIAGIENPDEGSIELTGEKIAYLPQEFKLPTDLLIGEYLESLVDDHHSDMWKIDVILDKLKLKIINDGRSENSSKELIGIDFYANINTLSEGQRMKLFLTKLLVEDPTILLLDEPTNHLDINGIEWFEEFVQNFEGICIIISHDRSFLNNTVDQIFEIDNKQLHIFHGNYDDYIHEKEKWIEKQHQQFHLQERKREKLELLLKRARSIKSSKKRSTAVSSAKKRMEREVTSSEIDKYEKTQLSDLNIGGSVHSSKTILSIKDLNFGYKKSDEDLILKDCNLEVFGKEKIWLLGANGTGKTTLVKLIIGELNPNSGEIKIGDNTKWTYFSQNQSHLPGDQTMREYMMQKGHIAFDKSYGILEKFLFPKKIQDNKISTLSPGQRARLSIAAFSQHEYDFLILDEPTNHLDIKTKEVIEDALRNFGGTIFLISHDRYFVESVGVDRVVTIEDRGLVELVDV